MPAHRGLHVLAFSASQSHAEIFVSARELLAVSLFLFAALCSAQPPSPAPDRDTYLRLASEVDNALHNDVLGVWFPAQRR